MLLLHFWAYSILSSLITFILIMILRRFFEIKLKVIIPYKIWLFTLISVVIPLIPFKYYSFINFLEQAKKSNYTNNNVIYNDVLSETVSKTSDLAVNVNRINNSTLIIILVFIWSIGIVFMFFRYLIGVKQIRDIENENQKMLRLENILSRCILDSNVLKTKVRIGYSSKVDNPMVFWKNGYSIILPQKLLRNLSDKELKLVIFT
ncbi:M56 family metallopeptidase [Staphylococcus simulans]|uniref:M56 family metallopeptidase n=1 Tax=Staphylococcus simulans TaxID=1286 RepID=UPI0021D2AF2E|nr:M56 family metallopeptidase [Staphylococcus simulans]